MYLYIISKGAWHSRFPGLPGALDSKQKGGRPMPRIAVVDDQPDMRQQLCSMIDQYSRENNCMLEVTAFSDGAQIITNYCKGFDIIFLDIEMPELGGMDAAERIRTVDPDVVLVFVTNMAQYAIRGYEVDALDFVLKPVNYYQFSTKLARALQRVQRRKGGQIALQTAGGVQLLNTEDIYWLETRDRMLHYHTSTGVWSVRSSLQNAEKQLAPYHFAKCNQCYLVNLRYVRAVQNDMVQVGEDRLEISRRQRAAFLAAVAAYVGGCHVMLPNLQQFLSLLVCGIQLWGAALTYWLPLRHSPHFWQRALLCLISSIPLSTFLLWADHTPSSLFLRAGAYILFCMWMIFASHSCTQLDWSGANYCAIWGILSALTTFELWQLLVWCLAQVNIFLPLDQPSALLLQLLFFAAAYCLLRVTVAHSMPYEGSYHIGPRQQISAIILGGMFVLLFLTMQTVTSTGVSRETSIFVVVPLALCQLYCITLLYLQTELFKKAAMEKEMNSLNMLYERQRQQYQVAKRNVQIINRKCHELKVQIADLRRMAPNAALQQSLNEAEAAARQYDASTQTGSEVLDVVLTEKSMLCEAHHISINNVADGTCLHFMDPADLYALFANALDHAIELTRKLPEPEKRMIDLLVCRRQGFAVLNIISAVPDGPDPGRETCDELKIVKRIIQKYNGFLTTESNGGFFAIKAVFPVQ